MTAPDWADDRGSDPGIAILELLGFVVIGLLVLAAGASIARALTRRSSAGRDDPES